MNISGMRYKELLSAEQRLQELNEQQSMQWFVEQFKEALGTLCASTPWSSWTEREKIAFAHAAKKAPTAAQLYKSKLPMK